MANPGPRGTLILITVATTDANMSMRASDYDLELEDLHRKSVHRLLAADTFDAQAFTELKRYLCEKAERIKEEHVVSKQVLSALLEAAGAIECRAEYVPSARENIGLANEFRMLLELIAVGEGCHDRKPGVPRVR